MGVCWYCHWGWSKPVMEIYEAAQARLLEVSINNWSALHFGPSHVVWEDENFDSAEWCLEHFDEFSEKLTEEEKKIVRWSLEELAKIPLEIRCPEPKDYDGKHPELYPAAQGIEMIRD